MRKIENYFDSPPSSMTLESLTTQRKQRDKDTKKLTERKSVLEEVLETKRIESDDYNREGVKQSLLDIYGRCCAFCEARVGKYDDIEHYRPKHEITGVNKIGYYWLGFVWSNFLISCKECNNDFKKNHFPLEYEQDRVTTPKIQDAPTYKHFFESCHIQNEYLKNEKPLLLHPAIDNPEEHLIFNSDGTVSAKDNSPKGLASIEYYGLSNWDKRKDLIIDRKRIVGIIEKCIRKCLDEFEDLNKLENDISLILYQLSEARKPTNEDGMILIAAHSTVMKVCLERFEEFFIESDVCKTQKEKDRLKEVFHKIKSFV